MGDIELTDEWRRSCRAFHEEMHHLTHGPPGVVWDQLEWVLVQKRPTIVEGYFVRDPGRLRVYLTEPSSYSTTCSRAFDPVGWPGGEDDEECARRTMWHLYELASFVVEHEEPLLEAFEDHREALNAIRERPELSRKERRDQIDELRQHFLSEHFPQDLLGLDDESIFEHLDLLRRAPRYIGTLYD